jgi:hypothetical protein
LAAVVVVTAALEVVVAGAAVLLGTVAAVAGVDDEGENVDDVEVDAAVLVLLPDGLWTAMPVNPSTTSTTMAARRRSRVVSLKVWSLLARGTPSSWGCGKAKANNARIGGWLAVSQRNADPGPR